MVDLWFPSLGPVTVQVQCGGGRGRTARHPVTIAPDWSVTTPHDMELELIAAAFGSRIACVDLVTREVPCARSVWSHRQRLAEPGIRRAPDGRWVVIDPVPDCRCAEGGTTWRSPEDAAEHLRTVRHWARHHRAGEAACQRLIEKLEHEAGTDFDSGRRTWPRSVAVHHHTDFAWLWEAGVHPDQVARIHADLRLPEPMHAIAYLHIAALRIDLTHLRPYVADGADAVAWAATTWTDHDTAHPTDRTEWYRAGLNWRLITELLGGPYPLADVRSLAVVNGCSLNSAGHVLSGWLAAGCEPAVADIARVCRLVPHGRQAPPADALDLVLRTMGRAQAAMSRDEVALILVAAGTPTGATALIRRGVRTLDDFLAISGEAAR